MSSLSLLSFIVLYPIVLAGDSCILIAIALVATTGGNPWVCGAAFAFFHALYAVTGTLLAAEAAHYSETLGGIIVFIGTLVLLKHFIHHRLHHGSRGDCSCEHHEVAPISSLHIISTSAALSIHALAAGPILSHMSGVTEQKPLVIMLLGASVVIGLLISFVVLIGETRRATIMRVLDALPGFVTAGLVGIASYALFHVVEHAIELPNAGIAAFALCATATSIGLGYWMHNKTGIQHPLGQIPSRLSKS